MLPFEQRTFHFVSRIGEVVEALLHPNDDERHDAASQRLHGAGWVYESSGRSWRNLERRSPSRGSPPAVPARKRMKPKVDEKVIAPRALV